MDLIYYLHILIESIVVFIEVALQVCVRLLNVQRFKAAWDCIIARLGHIGNTWFTHKYNYFEMWFDTVNRHSCDRVGMHSYRKWTELSFCTCTCLNLVPFIPLQKLWMIRIPDLSHIGDFPDRDGWVCIITGPTSGIGKETAREMFQRGYHGKNHWHGCPAYCLRQLYYRSQKEWI